jgi:hypothetical protein
MGERVLVELGLPPEVAAAHTRRFREHDEDLLRRQYLIYDDEAALVQTAQDSRQDLMRLFEAASPNRPALRDRQPAGPNRHDRGTPAGRRLASCWSAARCATACSA